jgi:hypothetical protein
MVFLRYACSFCRTEDRDSVQKILMQEVSKTDLST